MLLMRRHLVGRVLWLVVVGANWGSEKVLFAAKEMERVYNRSLICYVVL